MRLLPLTASLTLVMGAYLLWCAEGRKRGHKNPVVAVGVLLVVVAMGLAVIDAQAHWPSRAPAAIPVSPEERA